MSTEPMQLTERHKEFLRRVLIRGRLRPLGHQLYAGATWTELTIERMLDRLNFDRTMPNPHLINKVTAIIKTFERPHKLNILIESIRRMYPELRIIVVDDSRHPQRLPGVETVVLPYDSGVSLGRREGLKRVQTEYMLLLDDDYVFFRHSRLEPAIAAMDRFSQIDIMGGEVIDLPFYLTADYGRFNINPGYRQGVQRRPNMIGPFPVYNKVANFYIGRTQRIRLIDWDPAIKRIDHQDFFARAHKTLTSVCNPVMKCLHVKSLFDPIYLERKKSVAQDVLTLAKRDYTLKNGGWVN